MWHNNGVVTTGYRGPPSFWLPENCFFLSENFRQKCKIWRQNCRFGKNLGQNWSFWARIIFSV